MGEARLAFGTLLSTFKTSNVFGVDFSGAKQAGRTIWIARAETSRNGRLRLVDLASLESLCGHCDREPALRHLVDLVAASDAALWGIDFPFGLPVEILDDGHGWPEQIRLLNAWRKDAYDFGLWCVNRTQTKLGRLHVRRSTDIAAKTPFDCYHYRIIYQMFHGMRDVLGPLMTTRGTAILPFQYHRLRTARRVVVEACPGSTLKRWGVAHQRYKQPAGGPLKPIRRRTRQAIVDAVAQHVAIDDRHRRLIMRDPGGDALDAVIAAAGAFQAFESADHAAIARDERHPREGYLYV